MNTIRDLLKSGDRDAINAYLASQTITGGNQGGFVGDEMISPPQPKVQPQIQPQPMNTIRVESTGEYLTPQGTRSAKPVQFGGAPQGQDKDYSRPPVQLPDGRIGLRSKSNPNVIIAKDDSWTVDVTPKPTMREQMADMEFRKGQLDLQKAEAELRGGGQAKPTFSPELGGYVYAPSAENPQGKFVPVAGMTPKGEKSTEGERKASSLLMRLEGSSRQLEDALKQQPSAAKPGLIASGLRGVGLDALAQSAATGAQRQRIEAAQLDILDSALTLGTGASYTKEQLEGYRQSYFPQIGDSPEVIADKRDRLQNVINAAKIAAGNQAARVAEAFPENVAQPQEMKGMPNPASAAGRTVRDTSTGIRYKSDGSRWVRVQ